MTDPDVIFLCPRRVEAPGPWTYSQGPDTFQTRGGEPVCSYCGSLEPERFLELAREGWDVGPTDKTYKAYLTDPASHETFKVYYQHLSQPQRERFIEMHNAQEMRISYPGYFYIPPYFTGTG